MAWRVCVYDENINFKMPHSFHIVHSFKVILYLQENVSWQEISANAIDFEIFYTEDPFPSLKSTSVIVEEE